MIVPGKTGRCVKSTSLMYEEPGTVRSSSFSFSFSSSSWSHGCFSSGLACEFNQIKVMNAQRYKTNITVCHKAVNMMSMYLLAQEGARWSEKILGIQTGLCSHCQLPLHPEKGNQYKQYNLNIIVLKILDNSRKQKYSDSDLTQSVAPQNTDCFTFKILYNTIE